MNQADKRAKHSVTRKVRLGLIGGLAGTIAMDLVMVMTLSAMGKPASIFFSFIGEAASAFLSIIRITVAGGVPLGIELHYLIGLLLGLIFATVVTEIEALRANTLTMDVVLGIIYTEVVSTVLLLPAALVLRMDASSMLQLLGLAFGFHLVYGAVVGVVVGYRLRCENSL